MSVQVIWTDSSYYTLAVTTQYSHTNPTALFDFNTKPQQVELHCDKTLLCNHSVPNPNENILYVPLQSGFKFNLLQI